MTPSNAAASPVGLAIGTVMASLGVYIGLRVLAFDAPALTGTVALDLAFAVFFLARGGMQYRRWRLARESLTLP